MDTVFIIAEAGVNHNGDIKQACKLIDAAAEAGADAVKFQTFKSEKLVSKSALKARYQTENTADNDDSQLEMIKKLELRYEDFTQLKSYCDMIGIRFMTTPDESESADFIYDLVDVYKIGSGELTNIPYLKHIAAKGKPIILSTGMSFLGEVEAAVNAILQTLPEINSSFPPLTLMHCTTDYPADYEDVNLKAMLTMKNAFNLPVGYSDHTMGIEISIAAAALGATVIEKHFTLDKNMEGPDHKASLEPKRLKAMVTAIRNVEKAFSGDALKKPTPNEMDMRLLIRKSLIADRFLKAGTRLAPDMFSIKRPGNGVQPSDLDKISGMTLLKDLPEDEMLTWKHLK
ncbi:MAG: N-acetylneuraminate synthase [Lentisphaerae bacterium GWF2_44_16]|nr:MAG: N-acetylneuraminate synthase [Lentisphaerae bacterium GWF2_44_16]